MDKTSGLGLVSFCVDNRVQSDDSELSFLEILFTILHLSSAKLMQPSLPSHILGVKSTQDRASYNFTVVRNAMPMSLWTDRKIDWRVRDAWPRSGMGSAPVIMRDAVLRNET